MKVVKKREDLQGFVGNIVAFSTDNAFIQENGYCLEEEKLFFACILPSEKSEDFEIDMVVKKNSDLPLHISFPSHFITAVREATIEEIRTISLVVANNFAKYASFMPKNYKEEEHIDIKFVAEPLALPKKNFTPQLTRSTSFSERYGSIQRSRTKTQFVIKDENSNPDGTLKFSFVREELKKRNVVCLSSSLSRKYKVYDGQEISSKNPVNYRIMVMGKNSNPHEFFYKPLMELCFKNPLVCLYIISDMIAFFRKCNDSIKSREIELPLTLNGLYEEIEDEHPAYLENKENYLPYSLLKKIADQHLLVSEYLLFFMKNEKPVPAPFGLMVAVATLHKKSLHYWRRDEINGELQEDMNITDYLPYKKDVHILLDKDNNYRAVLKMTRSDEKDPALGNRSLLQVQQNVR